MARGGALYSTGRWAPIPAAPCRSANTDVLIKYTYYGDADLDGVVDAASRLRPLADRQASAAA